MKRVAVLGVLLLAFSAHAGAGADEHLLAGARAFREERYGTALVEFRVAEKLGRGAEAAGYAAAALVKLGRPEEALETFASSPAGRDPLLDYYRALACYGAHLYVCADTLLAAIGSRAGPRIAEQAQRTRAVIAKLLEREPPAGAVRWYSARAAEAQQAGRAALARAYEEEAAALRSRRPDQPLADGSSR